MDFDDSFKIKHQARGYNHKKSWCVRALKFISFTKELLLARIFLFTILYFC